MLILIKIVIKAALPFWRTYMTLGKIEFMANLTIRHFHIPFCLGSFASPALTVNARLALEEENGGPGSSYHSHLTVACVTYGYDPVFYAVTG